MSSLEIVATVLVGFASGYLSGQLGVGGGILTTPAIRLMLEYPAYVAVGTPLAVIIPTTIVSASQYARARLVDWRLAAQVSVPGLAGVIAGAYVTRFVSGSIILVATSLVMIGVALRMVLNDRGRRQHGAEPPDRPVVASMVGLVAGVFSGFLGLGGGAILVPAFVGPLGRDIKTAFGTSLVAICAFAVPGTIVHWLLGHIDLRLAALLMAGVAPGAWLGARVAIKAQERVLRLAFACFLALVAVVMAAVEIAGMV